MSLRIAGGETLLADGSFATADLRIDDGGIVRVGADGGGARVLDARGLLVLPGIVDIHGDAFERQVQPRPGVAFPMDIAIGDTDAQLLANGITTAFHGVTLSWEPGLRGAEAWTALLDAVDAARPTLGCDTRIHLRWEAYNLDALDLALADIAAGRVHLLAFNDHTPSILRKLDDPVTGAKFSDRAGMKLAAFRELGARIAGFAPDVAAARDRIAAAARGAGIPMASHDDDSIATRDGFRALGATICEFPIAEEVGTAARAAGDWVAMGCPNVVRGGSHLGWASAAELSEAGICRVLTSDYYYPAMAQAPFVLERRGRLNLAAAWALVSANPAAAAGLRDRGHLSTGARADVVLVDARGARPRVVLTIAAGRIVHAGPQAHALFGDPV